jgi:amidophosphoribosyltransferase
LDFDGGYALAGIIGHGDAFVLRDPAASAPPLVRRRRDGGGRQRAPRHPDRLPPATEEVRELDAGPRPDREEGRQLRRELVREPLEKRACSFERIYFSRGSDARRVPRAHRPWPLRVPGHPRNAVDHDLENTVFSFIPNTAEVACYGMLKEMEDRTGPR